MDLTIGICDDNSQQVQILKRYIKESLDEMEVKIISSINPKEFLELIEASEPHIVFLDIAMGEHNGIDIGMSIREQYENAVIIYVTAYDDYALDAFQVRAFHYLLKPIQGEKLHKVLNEAVVFLDRINNKVKEKCFIIKTKQEIIKVNYNDIFYFEKMGHKIKVITEVREVHCYGNFSNLVKKIDADSFVRCHQGYIVNIHKIKSLKNNMLFLHDNKELPVSRSYIKDVRKVLANKLFER